MVVDLHSQKIFLEPNKRQKQILKKISIQTRILTHNHHLTKTISHNNRQQVQIQDKINHYAKASQHSKGNMQQLLHQRRLSYYQIKKRQPMEIGALKVLKSYQFLEKVVLLLYG